VKHGVIIPLFLSNATISHNGAILVVCFFDEPQRHRDTKKRKRKSI